MALVVRDRVKESSASTGVGDFTLTGAFTGFQAFSTAMVVGDATYYTITNDSTGEYEVGLGTYSATNTLTRVTVFSSSNSNAAVNFGAGPKVVFITAPAEQYISRNQSVAYSIALGG
jgi:hypothetical protein|tara:strand:- start:4236 stop:4586 length:351 start_codon:yes stop_codon:yes gene_type:complete